MSTLRIDFVTIFPRMIEPLLAEGVIARGVKQGLIDIRIHDLRELATDKHRSTDDEAYGGGPGMVMLVEPVLRVLESLNFEFRISNVELDDSPDSQFEIRNSKFEIHTVLPSPQGRTFNQYVAHELAAKTHLVFLCGRYEGFDERVHDIVKPDEISIGDFVVSGGELPAMLIADAVCRLIEGVVGNSDSVEADSFYNGLLDYPHYTRPEETRGLRVPDILLSGHHENIRRWRKEQSLRRTLARRPDLLEKADLDAEAREILRKIENETD
ncbi:MAG: tRNA (guanosine(37)-N1)-methyltransferase TrmD [Thermoanaerobaculia bacterium]